MVIWKICRSQARRAERVVEKVPALYTPQPNWIAFNNICNILVQARLYGQCKERATENSNASSVGAIPHVGPVIALISCMYGHDSVQII